MAATVPRPPRVLDDGAYDTFRGLILERTGIHFGPRRRDELARGVHAASARVSGADLSDYADRLKTTDTNSVLWDDLIAEISIGESYFFRDEAQMLALRTVILPERIDRHRADRTLRIWSAGCSTGEEAYSLAMLLVDLIPDLQEWNLLILATDINRRALSHAAGGLYREWSFRSTEKGYRNRHFIARDGLFELCPAIARMVTFGYLNLAAGGYPSLITQTIALDVILCRNVAIYLPQQVVRTVAQRLHECLLPDGYLVVGASEADPFVYNQFKALPVCGASVYQKTPAGRPVGDVVPAGHGPARAAPPPRPVERAPAVQPPAVSPPAPPRMPADPQPAFLEGLALLAASRPEEAVVAFCATLAAHPGFAPAHHALARVHANRGDLAEARAHCERAIECDPGLAEAHYTLALICVEGSEPDAAVGCLKKALYLEPKFALAHYSLANILERAGRSRDAERHRAEAARAVAAMPDDEVVAGSEDLTGAQLRAMLSSVAGAGLDAGRNHG